MHLYRPLYNKNLHYKPSKVESAWPSMARLRIAAWAIFDPPRIFK